MLPVLVVAHEHDPLPGFPAFEAEWTAPHGLPCPGTVAPLVARHGLVHVLRQHEALLGVTQSFRVLRRESISHRMWVEDLAVADQALHRARLPIDDRIPLHV